MQDSTADTPIPLKPYPFFFGLLWRHFRWRTAGLTLFAGLGIGLMGFEPLLMRDLVEALRASEPQAEQIWRLFFWIVIIWFASAACNRMREWVDLYTAPQLRLQAQREVYHWLDRHAPRFFQDQMAGSVSQKVKQAGSASVMLLGIVFNGFVRMVVAIAMSALILASAPGHFFWVFAIWLLGFVLLSMWFAVRSVPLFKAFGEEVSSSTGVLVDINSHMDVVRANARHLSERQRVLDALLGERRASMNTRRFLLLMMWVLYTALLAFQCAFIGMAVQAFLAGQMSVGEVVMVISLAAILVTNVWSLCEQLLGFFEQVGTLGAALAVIARPHEILEAADARPLQLTAGDIRFENVRYAYQDGRILFENLNLHIRAGERVGLVGPSGAGKSTLTRLLRRHYDLSGGRILIDGQDIAQVTLASLNLAIADVPQDPALFHRSLRDNIAYPRQDASDDEVMQAARAAHCEDFMARRQEGLNVIVGERGIRLSGGERQRVALARAFVKNAPLLVLDEATSALDSETEAKIQDAIDQLCQGRTVIAIAHRLSTLSRMDRIVVMDHGQIVEEGTHAQLLAHQGHYARLWACQSAGFIPDHGHSGPAQS
ncbi:MAG: ABC transporter ATP-binding protein [Limnohabitans sp.]